MLKKYFTLVKFSHTIFAMPFALIGFYLAEKTQELSSNIFLLALVILSMIFARNAAMSFNRYIDRNYDKKNPRTAIREIPSGKISEKSAIAFITLNSLLFICTTYFINSLSFYLSPVALIVVLGYSYTKRFTYFCHFVLGLGLALAPIGAYIAIEGKFAWLPLLFSFIVLFWVSGFDIIYSLQDSDFDKTENLKSIPVKIGLKNALYLSSFLHFIVTFLVIFIGIKYELGISYFIGAIIFISLLIYQHLIVSATKLNRINLAFFTTNGIASVIYSTLVILDKFI